MRRRLLAPILVAAAASLATPSAAGASTKHGQLGAVRRATAQYRTLAVAQDAGYGILLDAQGIACIDMPGLGAMGVHYVRGDLVGDAAVEPTTPEALVYEPDDHGRMRLVAVEYVVFQSAWDAAHDTPPALFGETFMLTEAGNRFGLPAYYSLHAWVWRHNPAGTFAMWNPKVSCNEHCPDAGDDDGHDRHST
jgi:hypothetical protein